MYLMVKEEFDKIVSGRTDFAPLISLRTTSGNFIWTQEAQIKQKLVCVCINYGSNAAFVSFRMKELLPSTSSPSEFLSFIVGNLSSF